MLKATSIAALVIAAIVPAAIVPHARAEEKGVASYYYDSHHSGLFAAHKTLPFGSKVRVHNSDNGRSVVVTIVDRGPFVRGRILDVCPRVADALGFRQAGHAHVWLEPLGRAAALASDDEQPSADEATESLEAIAVDERRQDQESNRLEQTASAVVVQ